MSDMLEAFLDRSLKMCRKSEYQSAGNYFIYSMYLTETRLI